MELYIDDINDCISSIQNFFRHAYEYAWTIHYTKYYFYNDELVIISSAWFVHVT